MNAADGFMIHEKHLSFQQSTDVSLVGNGNITPTQRKHDTQATSLSSIGNTHFIDYSLHYDFAKKDVLFAIIKIFIAKFKIFLAKNLRFLAKNEKFLAKNTSWLY